MSGYMLGIYGTRYDIPDPNYGVNQVRVTRGDGKVFYIPVADLLDVAEFINQTRIVAEAQRKIGQLTKGSK